MKIMQIVSVVAATLMWLCTSGVALAEPSTTTVLYYHNDLRGDPVVVTTETGAIQWIESYRAYGEAEPRVSSAGMGFGDNAAENHNSRLGYTGHEKDGSSGLTYMKARYYDGLTGRFVSNDPVGYSLKYPTMSFGRYTYANNNPYTFVDPDGKESVYAPGTDAEDDNHSYFLQEMHDRRAASRNMSDTVEEGSSHTGDATVLAYSLIGVGGAKATHSVWSSVKGLFGSKSVPNSTVGAMQVLSFGKNSAAHFRSHSQHIRETARRLGIGIPKGPASRKLEARW